MILYSKVTTVPAEEPVTVAEAKTHLEVTGSAKDAYIGALIKAARRVCENYSGLSFITQTRELKLDKFPCYSISNPRREIILPNGPVSEITSFDYIDSDGNTQTLTVDTDYYFDSHSDIARLRAVDSWPSAKLMPNAISIEYTAGIDLADDTSGEYLPIVKQAILLQVATFFENRQDEVPGSMSEINWSSKTLLDSIKVTWNASYD